MVLYCEQQTTSGAVMDITLDRESIETLLMTAKSIVESTNPIGPEDVSRTEVCFKNYHRRRLEEAVYQAERALYLTDTKDFAEGKE